MKPTFLFQDNSPNCGGVLNPGVTQTQSLHSLQLPLLQVPCVPSLDSRECKHLSKEFVNCDTTLKIPSATYSAILSCWYTCLPLLQAALTWTDPGWTQFRSVKTHTYSGTATAETPHASGVCFAGELTALVPGCPPWLHHCCLCNQISLQLHH